MLTAPRPFFRERALVHYRQRQQQPVLPRLVSPPIFIYFWILLSFLLVAIGLAWSTQVPSFVTATGVLQPQVNSSPSASTQIFALLFLPTSQASQVRVGQHVQLQLVSTASQVQDASTDLQFTGTVSQIEPGTLSPLEAGQRYHLASAAIPTHPSIVVIVKFATALDASIYAGSLVNAHIQSGTHRVLGLLPGIGQLIGG